MTTPSFVIDSDRLAQRFTKAYASYRANASVQGEMASRLMDYLSEFIKDKPINQALEMGVGSGLLTDAFLERFVVNRLYLNDLYRQVRLNPLTPPPAHHRYLIGDIQTISLPSQLDLVLSSAMLQWIYPADKLLARLYQAMADGGVLAIGSFVKGNLGEIHQLTGQGLTYDTADELACRFIQAGFVVDVLDAYQSVLYFDSPMAVLRHMQATGVTAAGAAFRWDKGRLAKFCDDYANMATDLGYALTYCPVLIIAHKPIKPAD
ncbi:methyltransferase domain-containing protein [Moraxella marmotae]|uniref:methyltransferase domain-containing protein n=1 Tax=Moraxella marmotae TaxID=3344520 RepID=UPI0035F272A6